jgi:hypothetical protein
MEGYLHCYVGFVVVPSCTSLAMPHHHCCPHCRRRTPWNLLILTLRWHWRLRSTPLRPSCRC